MSFFDVFAGECRKAWRLPPLQLTVCLSLILMAAYCMLDSRGARRMLLAESLQSTEGMTAQGLGVYALANLAFFPVIAAVLVASSEHVGGQMSTSVLAVPRRSLLVAAKFAVAALIAAVQAVFLSAMILVFYQVNLGNLSVFANGEARQYLTTLGSGAAYWVLLGLLSVAVAMIFRSQTAVLSVMVLFSAAGLSFMMISKHFQYLPTNAGLMMFIGDQTQDLVNPPDLQPFPATVVVVLWTAAAMAAAATVVVRRDVGARRLVSE